MVAVTALWGPILLAAVLVFVASFLAHMLLPHHRGDWRKVPAEDDVMEALRRFQIPPGDYMLPCGGGPEAMKSPEFLEKMKKGPVALLTVIPAVATIYLMVWLFGAIDRMFGKPLRLLMPDETYLAGTELILRGYPDAGSALDGWTNCPTLLGKDCLVSGAATVTANFRRVNSNAVKLITPNGGEELVGGSQYIITWEAPVNAATCANVPDRAGDQS